MKTKYILPITALSFCLNTIAQTTANRENYSDDLWTGVQSTLGDLVDNIRDVRTKAQDPIRKSMLRHNDIRMWMNAKYSGPQAALPIAPEIGFVISDSKHEGEIYGEFDWDNKALMLEGTTTEYETTYGMVIGNSGKEFHKQPNPEETIVQYTDKDGYWYVPYDNPDEAGPKNIKFNAKQLAIGAMQGMMDISIDIMANKLAAELIGLGSVINLEHPGMAILDRENILYAFIQLAGENGVTWGNHYEKLGDEKILELQKQLEEKLKIFLDEELADTVGFPVFIHWALLYSPESIKAKFNVSDDPATFKGNPNCRKLTVLSGSEKGKSMTFDQYDRLVFINALKEGTARFAYDKDVTVRLPEAVDMSDMIGNIFRNKQYEEYKEIDRITKANKEKIKRDIENQEQIDKMRKEELKELKERLKEAITPQEREDVQEQIDKAMEPIVEEIKDWETKKEEATTTEEKNKIQQRIDMLKELVE